MPVAAGSGLAFARPTISLLTLVGRFQVVNRQQFTSRGVRSSMRVYDLATSIARMWAATGLVFAVCMVMSMLSAP